MDGLVRSCLPNNWFTSTINIAVANSEIVNTVTLIDIDQLGVLTDDINGGRKFFPWSRIEWIEGPR